MFATALSLAHHATAADAPRSPTPASQRNVFDVSTVANGIEHGWGFAFLPDNRILVTERPGRMRIVGTDGKLSAPLQGLPPIAVVGQGGLLDVTLSPDFANDRLVYFSFAEAGDGGVGTAVARGRLAGSSLENVQVIWRQQPKVDGGNHFGSRIVFRGDGTLFITLGDRYSHREKVQDLGTTIGKVVRINADGSVPRDNPFVDRAGARAGDLVRTDIATCRRRRCSRARASCGRSNTARAAATSSTIRKPAATTAGRSSRTESTTRARRSAKAPRRPGMEQPVYYWDPVIAPAGAVFYTGQAFAQWQGDLFVGSMTPGCLVRLDLENGRVREETRYLGELRRFRDVQQGSDGLLYVLTDAPRGRVLKLAPKKR